MRNNQNGFGLQVALILIVFVGIVSIAGWRVWQGSNNGKNNPDAIQNPPEKIVDNDDTPSSYMFKPLGIEMDILPGWKVTDNSTDEYYHWAVENNGDSIDVYINELNRGWHQCDYDKWYPEETAAITEVAPTNHQDLTLLRWGYDEYEYIDIVPADLEYFTKSEFTAGPYVKNADLTPGVYFRCNSLPSPNTALFLYENTDSDSHKYDRIMASIKSNDPNAYTEIKTMMTSIRPFELD